MSIIRRYRIEINRDGQSMNIEGVSGGKEIVDLWCKHFCDLLNCVNNNFIEIFINRNHNRSCFASDMIYWPARQLNM